MPEGTVKWFSEQKGYGFIEQDDGKDLFVHHTGISGTGFKSLTEGQRVQFGLDLKAAPRKGAAFFWWCNAGISEVLVRNRRILPSLIRQGS
jgi:CspA family cold shock protein